MPLKQLWTLWYFGSGHPEQAALGPYRLLCNVPKTLGPIMSKARKVMYCLEAALRFLKLIADDTSVARVLGNLSASNVHQKSNELYEAAYNHLVRVEDTDVFVRDSRKRSRLSSVPDYSFTTLYNTFKTKGLLSD